MSEMVERVAMAILERRTKPDWAEVRGGHWTIDHDKELARAAIEAYEKHLAEAEFAEGPTLAELEEKERNGTLFGLERLALEGVRNPGLGGIDRETPRFWRTK